MDNFLKTLTARPNTLKTYSSLFHNWVEPFIESRNKWDIKAVKEMANWWVNKGLAPRTVKVLVNILSKWILHNHGIAIDTRAVVAGIMRQRQETEIKALSKLEMDSLLKETEGTDLHLLILLASHTGMRRGEVFGLKWKDVDFLKGEITIRRSYDGPTKNGKSRIVPISKKLEEKLLAVYRVCSDNNSEDRVISKNFDPNPGLKAACRRARIRVINFHSLRHTFASLALESGRSPRKVQQVLGHSNLSTTLNLYWSLTNDKLDLEFLE